MRAETLNLLRVAAAPYAPGVIVRESGRGIEPDAAVIRVAFHDANGQSVSYVTVVTNPDGAATSATCIKLIEAVIVDSFLMHCERQCADYGTTIGKREI